MTTRNWVAVAAAATFLAACGGGDEDHPATERVPPIASLYVDNFIGYLRELVVASADMLEPVDLSTVTPPTDDAADPSPVQ